MKKNLKWVVLGLLILIFILIIKNIYNEITIKNILEEQEKVNNYIVCLEENFNQRDYCARKQNSSYYYMDKLAEKYGYTYEINNKDIKIVKVGK